MGTKAGATDMKEFICPFTFLGYCVKAKELATDHFVYFSIQDDKEVLKRCKNINNRD